MYPESFETPRTNAIKNWDFVKIYALDKGIAKSASVRGG